METTFYPQEFSHANKRIRNISRGYSERLSRFLSPEAFTLYRRRGANLRAAQVSTVVFSPIYYPRGNIYRHRKYVFFHPENHWMEYQLYAGEMAYSRQTAARFSISRAQRSKKLSSLYRPTTTYDSMERLEICRAKGEECPHKPRFMAGSDGRFAFYCKYCNISWSTICTHRRIHITNQERANIVTRNQGVGLNWSSSR